MKSQSALSPPGGYLTRGSTRADTRVLANAELLSPASSSVVTALARDEDRCLRAALQAQLGEHRGDVVLDRLLRQIEPNGDLPVGQPFTDELEDVLLVGAQPSEHGVGL